MWLSWVFAWEEDGSLISRAPKDCEGQVCPWAISKLIFHPLFPQLKILADVLRGCLVTCLRQPPPLMTFVSQALRPQEISCSFTRPVCPRNQPGYEKSQSCLRGSFSLPSHTAVPCVQEALWVSLFHSADPALRANGNLSLCSESNTPEGRNRPPGKDSSPQIWGLVKHTILVIYLTFLINFCV